MISAPYRSIVIDSAPEPTPLSNTRQPGPMSAIMQIGAEVLRVDHLGARGILSTKSSSVGRSTRVLGPRGWCGGSPFGLADDLGVRHEPVVAVELLPASSVTR